MATAAMQSPNTTLCIYRIPNTVYIYIYEAPNLKRVRMELRHKLKNQLGVR